MAKTINIITAKRDGKTLSRRQITEFVDAYTRGEIPDYQASAFLMAAFCRGMDAEETTALTYSMLRSGEILDFSEISGPKIDKHSTGGVGDKVSLILAPIAASCGLVVPMISGRGLGITGGTRDKLESIPGFRTELTSAEVREQLAATRVAIIGPTAQVAPADRRLYALRDVTATVDFIPFISASIMSKKLAEGLDGLVLDVKCGRGAFMKHEKQARCLAESMVRIGLDFGVNTTALLTDMDVPLGRAIGNWLEVEESIRCLRGDPEPDVMEVTLSLAGEMLCLAGRAKTGQAGRALAEDAIASGRAFEKFAELVEWQGGDVAAIQHPERRQLEALETVVYAPDCASGYVADIDAGMLGMAATTMGVGRTVKEDAVDPNAGIYLHKRPGETVAPGTRLASFYTRKANKVGDFRAAILAAYRYSTTPRASVPVVSDRLSAEGWRTQILDDI